MKTIKTVLAAAVTSLLLAGCATSFKPWQLSEVHDGMDKAQILDILGQPDSSEMKDGSEYLYYSYMEEPSPRASTSADTPDDLERRADELSRSFKEIRYQVVLVDGKLINYKELQD